jgi:hypothetical protein
MRPSTGVLVVTQVEELVLRVFADGSFGIFAKTPATEETADLPLAFAESEARQVIRHYTAPVSCRRGTQARRLIQVACHLDAWRRLHCRSEQAGHHWLSRRGGSPQHRLSHVGGRRFRHDDDDLGRRVIAQQLERLKRRAATDLRCQVASAGADRMTDTLARLMQQARHFLQTCARGADQADAAAPDHVRKPESDAVQDRRAAVGAHDEQTLVAGSAFEIDLVFERHVVGEEEHVQTLGQGLARLTSREWPRHRDDG